MALCLAPPALEGVSAPMKLAEMKVRFGDACHAVWSGKSR